MNKEFFSNLKSDLPSGVVVFLVALPLCLGIALASGAPLFSGLITGIVGGIVVGALSGSSVSVSGPAAGLTVIVFSAIESLGSFQTFLLAVFLAGVIQLVMGIFKAGIVSHYFPSAVIKGMLAAIGLILIISQFKYTVGWNAAAPILLPEESNFFSSIVNLVNYIDAGVVIITLVSLSIMLVWEVPSLKNKQFFKLVPGGVVAVVAGILINLFYRAYVPELAIAAEHFVTLPVASGASNFLSQFSFPEFSALLNPQVYTVAITIAIVASIETLLCIEATDKLDPRKRITPTNRELKAQGVGNMICGLIGGLPMTSVIVRSSTNINSGSKSKASAIIHGFFLLIAVALIPHIMNLIPLASLAAILLVVGYKLANINLFKEMFKLGRRQFIPFIVTITAIVFTDLLTGIVIGMAVSIFFILRNNYKSPYHLEAKSNERGQKINIKLAEEVTFINKGSVLLTLRNIPENSDVVIDGSGSRNIDHDVKELLNNFKETAKNKNINFELKEI